MNAISSCSTCSLTPEISLYLIWYWFCGIWNHVSCCPCYVNSWYLKEIKMVFIEDYLRFFFLKKKKKPVTLCNIKADMNYSRCLRRQHFVLLFSNFSIDSPLDTMKKNWKYKQLAWLKRLHALNIRNCKIFWWLGSRYPGWENPTSYTFVIFKVACFVLIPQSLCVVPSFEQMYASPWNQASIAPVILVHHK